MKLRILSLTLAAVCCMAALYGCRGADVVAEAEAAGLNGLVEVLLRSVDMREPVEDAAQLPQEDIWHFILGTAGYHDGGCSDQPYSPNCFPWEERRLERTSESGEVYEAVYRALPGEQARQIAYEFFGVSDYSYKDPADLGGGWDGAALPDGIGLNDFNTPANIVRKAGEGGSFTVALDLAPGGMGEPGGDSCGRYLFHFRLMSEDGRKFVRFLRSERMEGE